MTDEEFYNEQMLANMQSAMEAEKLAEEARQQAEEIRQQSQGQS
ncbi:hypothetical protein [Streptomyces sp. ME19-01-6]|nr:hypothetical protein [Streptomyces sp. ME19-01-6]MDX3232863.1 hypothetical protein [Streptomyces sp. ME19-01-6]